MNWHGTSLDRKSFSSTGILSGKYDMSGEQPAPPPTIGAILEWYEGAHKDRIAKLQALPADKLVQPLPFFGVMELPAVAFLNLMNLHTSHHRGQLSTHLRPMGAKVPSIYGGSADEPFQASA